MNYDQDKIREAIRIALKDLDMQPTAISDAVFHMTDWLSDLEKWAKFCEKPNSLSPEKLQDLLIEFLVHVPNHLAAASKLVTGIPVTDVFKVGATAESKE
ncbi:MAG: hypothetical protein H6975_01465 [Gammaproteobacteria bacterium]|nr:hypothetical protein [Gammaproteobacteria bacterium]